MIDSKAILAIIPARGGSKGIPRKNLRHLGGKPLIGWTIEQARKSKIIDRMVVDTEDSEIAATARSFNAEVPFLRPAELATDESLVANSLIHMIDRLEDKFDYLVMLQCTSPLSTHEDIDGAITLCARNGAPACITVTLVKKPPQWTLEIAADLRIRPLMGWEGFRRRRQDLNQMYLPNGAVFVAEIPWFRKNRGFYGPDTVGYQMPPERSIDIDSEEDLRLVETLLVRHDNQ